MEEKAKQKRKTWKRWEGRKIKEGTLTGSDVGRFNVPVAIVFMVRLNILTLRSDMHPSVTQIFPRFLEDGDRGPDVKTTPVSCKPPSKHQPL